MLMVQKSKGNNKIYIVAQNDSSCIVQEKHSPSWIWICQEIAYCLPENACLCTAYCKIIVNHLKGHCVIVLLFIHLNCLINICSLVFYHLHCT